MERVRFGVLIFYIFFLFVTLTQSFSVKKNQFG